MVLGGTLTEWLTLFVLLLGPGLVATVLWSPVLAAGRLRALFRSLPLTGVTAVNYTLAALALSVPWVLGYGWALDAIGGAPEAARTGEPMVDIAVQLSGLYVVALPVAAAAGLPQLGVDWDPTGYESTTWLLLVAASAYYAAIYAVPAVLMGILFSL
ncbi:MAG: hypothetical protein U5J98_09300 [Halobacteriales archaeon]|nr:hypothetical protein [Halobacteriales archaeon]